MGHDLLCTFFSVALLISLGKYLSPLNQEHLILPISELNSIALSTTFTLYSLVRSRLFFLHSTFALMSLSPLVLCLPIPFYLHLSTISALISSTTQYYRS